MTMTIDRPSEGDPPQEPDERAERQRPQDHPHEDVASQMPEKDWAEDARRVYGPIDENTPTWHGRDAEGRDITGSGRPDLPQEEVEAHHLGERVREAAQIREGISYGVRYGDDTLEWVAKVEAEAATAKAPDDSAERARQPSGEHQEAASAEDDRGELPQHDKAVDQPAAPMPVDDDGRPALRTEEYAAWYRQHGGRATDAPAPYDLDVAEDISEYVDRPGGTFGRLLDGSGQVVLDQHSGYEGPAKNADLPIPPKFRWLRSHVEAHSVAYVRQHDMDEAVLYINRLPCPQDYPEGHPYRRSEFTCDSQMERWLPSGVKLTLHGPEGYWDVKRGRPDEGESHG